MSKHRRPNVVFILADDMGYGDFSMFNNGDSHTPTLDQLVKESTVLTQHYSAAPVCTPSRAALLTGRLPLRNGMTSDTHRVLFPDSLGGLPASEVTLAETQPLDTRRPPRACGLH